MKKRSKENLLQIENLLRYKMGVSNYIKKTSVNMYTFPL